MVSLVGRERAPARFFLSPAGGYTLIELIVVGAVLALIALLGAPPLMRLSSDLRVKLAAYELAGVMHQTRMYAIQHSANVGVKFFVTTGEEAGEGRVTFALYRDGNDDGVKTRDILSGADPQVEPERQLAYLGRHLGFGFPPGIVPRDPSDPRRPLGRLEDPIRFNNSDIAAFSSLGTATPGTLYLTDGATRLAAVRIYNRTGKVKLMVYHAEERRWQPF